MIDMEYSGFTTIEQRTRDIERFAHFMAITTEALTADANKNVELFSKQNGEKLEVIVLDKMRSLASDFDISPEKIRKSDRQHFPDILLDDSTFGVEVKSVKDKTWTSTGSSIVETLRESEIEKVFLLFGRLSAPEIDFRCKPYEECLSEIAVTHSPRYLINMDMHGSDMTIFEKMGISYDQFRKMGNEQINLVRKHYREKFRGRKNKSMPWWIGEDTVLITHPSELYNPSCEFRILSDMSESVKEYFKLSSYTLFPEILGPEQDKFRKPSLWLCSRFAIICANVRDFFTAGGTVNIFVNDELTWKNVPKIIANLTLYIHRVKHCLETDDELINDVNNFSSFYNGEGNLFAKWSIVADNYIGSTLSRVMGRTGGYEICKKQELNTEEMLSMNFLSAKTVNNKVSYYYTKA